MKPEKKIRNALIRLYWQAHNDGGLAEFDNNIREHLHSQKWADRRAEVIGEALRKIESAQQSFAPDSLKPLVKSLPKSRKTGKPLLAKSG